MEKQRIEAGKKYRVIYKHHFYLRPGNIVTAVRKYGAHLKIWVFKNDRDHHHCLHEDDVEPLVHVEQPPTKYRYIDGSFGYLPTWPQMAPQERHQLLGELIDAMIYSGHATDEVKRLVEHFKAAGYVRSVILPADARIDEPQRPDTNTTVQL